MSDLPLLVELVKFVKNPTANFEPFKIDKESKFLLILRLVSVMIFLAFISSFCTSFIINSVGYSQDKNNIIIDSLVNIPGWVSILFVTLVGPFSEELSFRFFLAKQKAVFLAGSFFYLVFLLTTIMPYFESLGNLNTYLLLFIFILIIIFTILFFASKADTIKEFVVNHIRFLVYFSAISFGLIHTTNYDNLTNYWWLAPLLVVPQLIVGFILPFIRIRLGFIWSFFAHALYNSVLAIYTLGVLAGPGNVSQLIKSSRSPEQIISTFTTSEQLYLNLISIASMIAYALVIFLAISTITQYFIWKSKKTVN